ncbi:hypothetical protein V8C44DRAFT_335905 [Trichoderma aethiopicum]
MPFGNKTPGGPFESRLTVDGNPKFSVALPSCKLLLQKKRTHRFVLCTRMNPVCSARISSLGTDGDFEYWFPFTPLAVLTPLLCHTTFPGPEKLPGQVPELS